MELRTMKIEERAQGHRKAGSEEKTIIKGHLGRSRGCNRLGNGKKEFESEAKGG